MSSRTRKLQREPKRQDYRNFFYDVDGNRQLRRAVRNRRVANPDRVDQLGSMIYIKAPFKT